MRNLRLMLLCALVLLLTPIVMAGSMRPGPCQIKEGAIVARYYTDLVKAAAIQQRRDKDALERMLTAKLVYRWSSTAAPNRYVLVEKELEEIWGTRVKGTLIDVWAMRADVTCPAH